MLRTTTLAAALLALAAPVQAEVAIECRSLTAAQIRGAVALSLETAASRTGPALVTMQGTATR